MRCRCGGSTQVLDSRLDEYNCVRRRRVCTACGKRFSTWETTRKPHQLRAQQDDPAKNTARVKAWREANPEKMRRIRLREEARRESKRSGIPVAELYARWDCA